MTDGLDFNARTFLAKSAPERIILCCRLAERAQELAEAADPKFRDRYLEIAGHWLALAQQMQSEADDSDETAIARTTAD